MSELERLWDAISATGSVDSYIRQQLSEHGFTVRRRDTDDMSKSQKAKYKADLKREAAEKRALKKKAWQAYRATHIIHLGDGIFFNDLVDFDRWDLEEPEARAAENELPQIDTPKQLADHLGLSISELRWLAYHRDVAKSIHYKRFTIPKRSGGEREIWAPMPKLKKAQRWILQNIVEHLPVHGNAHGFLPGRSILSNAKPHTNSRLIVNMDLKNFFPSVNWRRVKGVFRKAGYREQVATLLALICTEAPRQIIEYRGEDHFVALGPRCLPQGAPTSPALTNTMCMRLDRRLTGLAKNLGYVYTRYADDLTFSLAKSKKKGPPRTGQLMGAVKKIVADEGFVVNPKKTSVRRSGGLQQVTGLVVNGEGKPRVSRKMKRELRAAIFNLKCGKPLRDGTTLPMLMGWAAFISMTEPELGRTYLDALNSLE